MFSMCLFNFHVFRIWKKKSKIFDLRKEKSSEKYMKTRPDNVKFP